MCKHKATVDPRGPPAYQQVVDTSQQSPVPVFEKSSTELDATEFGNPVPSTPATMKKNQQPTPYEKYQQLSEADLRDNTIPYACLGRWPAKVRCEACGATGMTTVKYKISGSTHVAAGLFFLWTVVGAPFVYIAKNFKNCEHRCGGCGVHLVTHHPGSGVEVKIGT